MQSVVEGKSLVDLTSLKMHLTRIVGSENDGVSRLLASIVPCSIRRLQAL